MRPPGIPALIPVLAAVIAAPSPPARAQVVLTGRVRTERWSGSDETMYVSAILSFASLAGGGSEALQSRTWEMEPAGWFRMSGGAGTYTLLFSTPAHFARPIVMTNVFARAGETVDLAPRPSFDRACFFEGGWDEKRASHYYQTFVARGTSVTQIGFKLAHDGVDGMGPGGQTLLASIHRRGDGTPDAWERVGPVMPVPDVDCGGAKSYHYSAGWNSGEVPLTPGETYAVHLRSSSPGGTFQAFWRPDADPRAACYRIGPAGPQGFLERSMWMSIATDGDGIVIPYNKRVHKPFVHLTRGAPKWSQTYVARGRSLAGAVLYAAVGTAEPPLSRQRVAIRVREGGPAGPVVGVEKIGIGNGNYTGDASWGVFAAAFAPGEVPLEPGATYAIEFESIENRETLRGHINIKGQRSTEIPGFTPYRKVPPDAYPHGTAFLGGTEPVDFDLDMQILEYENCPGDWARAVDSENLLPNGDMEAGALDPDEPGNGRPDVWKPFAIDPGTVHRYAVDGMDAANRILRVLGGGATGKTVDGGFVQRVDGLSRHETYRIAGRVRSSWAFAVEQGCLVGFDPTGQDADPKAATIIWTPLPLLHGVFVPYASEPIRPSRDGAISVWLRGWTTRTDDVPFRADFDAFTLRRVRTDPAAQTPSPP
ncbi:MAG: hypothetical protein JXP34_02695 [Planctomycetes bacterium]|nr:hypothetical protein [Planctomycetota bacterium]